MLEILRGNALRIIFRSLKLSVYTLALETMELLS